MSRSNGVTKPRISLDLLSKMLERLTAEELARFPARKLPEQIPSDWLASLDPEQLARVRTLLAERFTQAGADSNAATSAEDLQVLDAVRHTDVTRLPAALRILQRDVGDLANLIHRWRNNLHATVEVRAIDSEFEFAAESRSSATGTGKSSTPPMARKREEIARLLGGLQSDFLGLFQAEWVLKARIEAGGDSDGRLAGALKDLREKVAPLEELLARFHTLNLTIMHHEMSDCLVQIESIRAQRRGIEQEIEALRNKARRGNGWLRSGGRTDSDDDLQARIDELSHHASRCGITLRREQVLRWLDSYIDAALDPLAQSMARRRMGEAREMLVRLIREFLAQVEQRARDYSGRVAPAGGMQLLRRYFASKADAPKLNYSVSATEISTTLMRLEKDLVMAVAEH